MAVTRAPFLLPIALAALGCNNTVAVTLDGLGADVPTSDLGAVVDAPPSVDLAPAEDAGTCTWDAAVEDVPVPPIHTPRWAFEPWISKDISTTADTYAFVDGFRERDIPVGAVVLARSARRLGGVTGDVMGAVVELATAAALVTAALAL